MCHSTSELAQRIQLLQLKELLVCRLQRLLGLPSFGDIARGLGESDQRAGLVTDRLDHGCRPELGAVLANTPALILEAPLLASNAQRLRRSAGSLILRRVETREIGADNLRRGVTLDAGRAGVPAIDPAFGVQ